MLTHSFLFIHLFFGIFGFTKIYRSILSEKILRENRRFCSEAVFTYGERTKAAIENADLK